MEDTAGVCWLHDSDALGYLTLRRHPRRWLHRLYAAGLVWPGEWTADFGTIQARPWQVTPLGEATLDRLLANDPATRHLRDVS